MQIGKLGQQVVARLKTTCTASFPQTMSNYIIANTSYASLWQSGRSCGAAGSAWRRAMLIAVSSVGARRACSYLIHEAGRSPTNGATVAWVRQGSAIAL